MYIPSKGRWQPNQALTVGTLQRDACPFRVVVEEPERKQYADLVGEENILVLPWTDHVDGLAATRRWIREHAEAEGHDRHWQLDDNIMRFRRIWKGQRIPMRAALALRVCEDLTDRFSNVGLSGLNYQMFVPPDCRLPHYENVHVYSCTLVNHAMPYTWRMRYNDDTDICLQALNAGWATILTNTVMADKLRTMKLGGGNTDQFYGGKGAGKGEGGVFTDTPERFKMAKVLEEAWPGIVQVVRKFGRWQHSVNWKMFKDVKLKPVDPDAIAALPEVDEMGIHLRAVQPPESELMKELLATFDDEVGDSPTWGNWRGLPGFVMLPKPPKLAIEFPNDEELDKFIKDLGLFVVRRKVQASSAWWPPKRRSDLSSLIFVGDDEAEQKIVPRIHPNAPPRDYSLSAVPVTRSSNGKAPAPLPEEVERAADSDFEHDFAAGPLRRPV